MRVSKKKIALVERLVKEELNRQFDSRDIIEIVDDSPMVLIREAEGDVDPDVDPNTVGGMAQLAQGASTGNNVAHAALQQSAAKVDIDADLQKLRAVLEGYGEEVAAIDQKVYAAMKEGGWEGLPAAQQMHNAMGDIRHQANQVLRQGFEGIEKAATTLQDIQKDVQEKGAEAAKTGKTGTGSSDIEFGTGPEDKGEKGEGFLKTMAKGLGKAAGATGLFKETTTNHRRLK